MKRVQSSVGEAGWFDRLSRQVEDRYGHWPTWRKIVVGIPIIVAMTALFMFCLLGLSDVVLAILALARRH